MPNAILISHDESIKQLTSLRFAQQLLRTGLVKIVKYYPLMVRFKNGLNDEGEGATVSANPTNLLPFSAKKLKSLEVTL